MGRSVAEGRFVVPDNWPKWNKVCGSKLRKRHGQTCRLKAVIGMPTCRFHGSGGEKNRAMGELRYLAWIICGGPQDTHVEQACRIAFAVYAERVFNQGKGSIDQQYKAALWLTQLLDDH